MKFTASVAGKVTGVRFYKQTVDGRATSTSAISGPRPGALLATATFTNETAYGWQQVNLSSPVAIQANTVYIVSFSTGGGYFGITTELLHVQRGHQRAAAGPVQQRRRRRRGL